jgi:tRNA A-37 threonylcarbamoyl transferase component Bud32
MMTEASRCPHCGEPLPVDAPAGVCPACVLRLGLETEAPGFDRVKAPELAELAASFPQFEILELVGQGGMGTVYKVRQRSLDRNAALKILSLDARADPAFEERFVRESRTLAQLAHPNIVTVFDCGKVGSLFYLVMEYVDGVNLREALRDGVLGAADSLDITRQICDALQYAHDHGVVHRDIKPENILLDGRGRVQIADFGLAKLLSKTPIDISLTATNQILGTYRYMAPEQIERPLSVDHRVDIYSLGVVLYELLTGELPLGRFALPSERGSIDAGLDRVVLRALERDPARRYQHASELKTDVTSVSSQEAIPTAVAPAPVMTVHFWAPTSLMANSTSQGLVELHADRVAFDFEVVSTWGPRSLRAVHVPLDRVRSVEFTHSWLKGKMVLMRVEQGSWTVQLPFTWEGQVWFWVGSKEEGEGFVAAMRERIGKVSSPSGVHDVT